MQMQSAFTMREAIQLLSAIGIWWRENKVHDIKSNTRCYNCLRLNMLFGYYMTHLVLISGPSNTTKTITTFIGIYVNCSFIFDYIQLHSSMQIEQTERIQN